MGLDCSNLLYHRIIRYTWPSRTRRRATQALQSALTTTPAIFQILENRTLHVPWWDLNPQFSGQISQDDTGSTIELHGTTPESLRARALVPPRLDRCQPPRGVFQHGGTFDSPDAKGEPQNAVYHNRWQATRANPATGDSARRRTRPDFTGDCGRSATTAPPVLQTPDTAYSSPICSRKPPKPAFFGIIMQKTLHTAFRYAVSRTRARKILRDAVTRSPTPRRPIVHG